MKGGIHYSDSWWLDPVARGDTEEDREERRLEKEAAGCDKYHALVDDEITKGEKDG